MKTILQNRDISAVWRSESLFIIFLFLAAFFVRVPFVIHMPPEYTTPAGDAAEYDELAKSLIEGRGFAWREYRESFNSFNPMSTYPGQATSFKPPLYPAFLALLYKVFGVNYIAVRIFQSAMWGALVVIIYLISKDIFGAQAGALAGLISTFFATFIRYSYFGGPGFLLTENIYIFLVVISVYLFLKVVEGPKPFISALSGFILGLATLSRPVSFLFPLFALAWLLYLRGWSPSKAARDFIPYALAFAIAIGPWTARNYALHGRFIPVTTQIGVVFLASNHPLARGGYGTFIDNSEFVGLSEVELSQRMFKSGLDYLLGNPWRIPKLFFRKAISTWSPFAESYAPHYGMILPLSVIGLIGSFYANARKKSALLLLLIIYSTLVAMALVGGNRFRYTIEPFLIVFGAGGALYLVKRAGLAPALVIFTGIVAINLSVYASSDWALSLTRSTFAYLGLR